MLACALKRESVAAMLLAAAETARDRLGVKRGVRSAEHWEKALAETRQALADLFSAAWSEGRALDLRGAAQLALTQVLAESA